MAILGWLRGPAIRLEAARSGGVCLEGFENIGSLIPLALTAVVSAIQMVGLIAIACCAGAAPLAEKLVDFLRSKMPRLDKAAQVIEEKVDAEKLVATLNSLDERIRSIEIKVGDGDE